MRNLTIKRHKSFVGCLGKMKVYIEDPAAGEITINKVPCRKLGTLKNGETQTFQIDDRAARVYVIADKLSKDYCNEYYQLPEGCEDIFLTGKNKYNPINGNPFRFDNNESAGVADNRKRGLKIGLIVLAAAVVVGFVVGFTIGGGFIIDLLKTRPKAFAAEDMTITLTSDFREREYIGFTTTYESKAVAVFVLEEKFTDIPGSKDYTTAEYARKVIEVNQSKGAAVKSEDGLTWFEYTYSHPESKDTFRYYSYVYKENDAFWLIQFAVNEEKAEELRPQIVSWAKSVAFDN